jgi:hypothetical protein
MPPNLDDVYPASVTDPRACQWGNGAVFANPATLASIASSADAATFTTATAGPAKAAKFANADNAIFTTATNAAIPADPARIEVENAANNAKLLENIAHVRKPSTCTIAIKRCSCQQA